MNENKLRELPDELSTKFGCSLKALFLRGNELTFVNQKVFQQCNGLRYLFLSDNKIAKVPPKLLQVFRKTVYTSDPFCIQADIIIKIVLLN